MHFYRKNFKIAYDNLSVKYILAPKTKVLFYLLKSLRYFWDICQIITISKILLFNILKKSIFIIFGIFIYLFQEGDFEMKHIDRVGSQSFNAAIAPFSLSILGDDSINLWEVKRIITLESLRNIEGRK